MDTNSLKKAVDKDSLLKTFRRISRRSNIFIGLFDLDHNVIAATDQQALCLNFHSKDPNLAAGCRDTGEYLEERVEGGVQAQRQCMSGLWDIAVPIMIQGEQVARLFVGQFFYQESPPDTALFRRWAQDYDLPMERYLKAVRRIPVLSTEAVGSIVETAKSACVAELNRAAGHLQGSEHADAV